MLRLPFSSSLHGLNRLSRTCLFRADILQSIHVYTSSYQSTAAHFIAISYFPILLPQYV